MKYISVKEASVKWKVSERRVRALCESGRIEGVSRCGKWVWSIPDDAPQPADGRSLRYIKNTSLRTGTQDYKEVDALKSTRKVNLTDKQIALIIEDAMTYSAVSVTSDQIEGIIKLKNQNLDLSLQVTVLNMYSCLKNLGWDVTENSILDVNSRLLQSVCESDAGKYKSDNKQDQQAKAMISQYMSSWCAMHPVARAAFLFSEVIRIDMFRKLNPLTAFVVLQNELVKAKLPPAVFTADKINQLKAALASSQIRGNASSLVTMIIEGIQKKWHF